jgi:hypothetical protein
MATSSGSTLQKYGMSWFLSRLALRCPDAGGIHRTHPMGPDRPGGGFKKSLGGG